MATSDNITPFMKYESLFAMDPRRAADAFVGIYNDHFSEHVGSVTEQQRQDILEFTRSRLELIAGSDGRGSKITARAFITAVKRGNFDEFDYVLDQIGAIAPKKIYKPVEIEDSIYDDFT